MPKEEIIENLQKCDSSEENELIELYLKNSYYEEIIDKITSFDLEKRKRIFTNLFKKGLNYNYINNQKTLINYHNLYRESGYGFDYDLVKKIDNLKECLDSKYILELLNKKDSKTLVNDYSNYFEDEILNKNDFYYLLEVKSSLKSSTVNKIYIETYDYVRYLNIKKYLTKEELISYSKVFTDEGYIDIKIIYDFLLNGYYNEDNIDILLNEFTSFATDRQIYDVLMTDNFDGKYKNMLEGALYDSGNIEYIAYYYFYKNKEKFILLFGSIALFLSYLLNNEQRFTNKAILSDVINKIKEETKEVSDRVNKLVLKNVNK